jgi:hypothetical protein
LDVSVEVVPIGVFVFGVMKYLVSFLDKEINCFWIVKIALFSKMTSKIELSLVYIDSSVELMHVDEPRHLTWLEHQNPKILAY